MRSSLFRASLILGATVLSSSATTVEDCHFGDLLVNECKCWGEWCPNADGVCYVPPKRNSHMCRAQVDRQTCDLGYYYSNAREECRGTIIICTSLMKFV